MRVRLHEPGAFSTASVGRVYLIHYRVLTNVETEQTIRDDCRLHSHAIGGRPLVLASSEHPPMPMPGVDVRAFWRGSLASGPGVEAFAALARGFVGLPAAAMTNLLEHMVDPGLGVRFRVFAKPAPAVAWLGATATLGASETQVIEQLEALRRLS